MERQLGRGIWHIAINVGCPFFSFHVYSEYPQLKAEQNILTKMMPPTFYKESIHRLQEKMALASFREMELHITEWNFSLYDRHLLHDTMFMAPFVMYHAMNTLGDVKARLSGVLRMCLRKVLFHPLRFTEVLV